jgi:hypothetical protein
MSDQRILRTSPIRWPVPMQTSAISSAGPVAAAR